MSAIQSTTSSFNNLINKPTISKKDRQILALHYLNGESFSNIGTMLNLTEKNVKKRHRKSLLKLMNDG